MCKGVLWGRAYGVRRRGRAMVPTLRARSVHPVALPGTIPLGMPPLGQYGEISALFSKVSQNDEVSPKYVHKASHSPYIQNGSQKSPLGFLRFPISVAFSHKELIGPF